MNNFYIKSNKAAKRAASGTTGRYSRVGYTNTVNDNKKLNKSRGVFVYKSSGYKVPYTNLDPMNKNILREHNITKQKYDKA